MTEAESSLSRIGGQLRLEPDARRGGFTFGGSPLAAKLFQIAAVTVVVLVLLQFVDGIATERRERGEGVVAAIAHAWGGAQRLAGPILVVPLDAETGQPTTLMIAPAELAVAGAMTPEVRYRGIWQALLYTADVQVTGRFDMPDLAGLGLRPEQVRLDQAFIVMGLAQPTGLGRTPRFRLGETEMDLQPGFHRFDAKSGPFPGGLGGLHGFGDAGGLRAGSLAFASRLLLRGTEEIAVHPLGRQTDVTLRAPWPHPGSIGDFLPARLDVDAEGFRMDWSIPFAARSYPAAWLGKLADGQASAQSIGSTSGAVGVQLTSRIDPYASVERATKYAVLFVVATLLLFLLCESVGRAPVHWVQYGLVGAALCLFYLLLLALAEQMSVALAYALAALQITLLVSAYAGLVLRSRRQALIVGPAMAGLYGLLFVILQSEDHALLMGSGLLLALLAAAMYLTRDMQAWQSMPHER